MKSTAGHMKIAAFSILLAGAMVAGCGRPDSATPGNALASPANGSGSDGARAPAAAGRTEAPRPSEAIPAAEAPRAAESIPVADASREITIAAGTRLNVTLDTAVGSDTSRVEEAVTAHLARAILAQGHTVLPAGSLLTGFVTDATRSAKVKGRAHVAVRFDSLTPRGEDHRYAIRTASIGRTAEGTKRKDAAKIAAPAAGGAIIGALLGGKKGALIGTAVGGGAGTAVVLSTPGKEVHLARGSALTLKLAAPVTVRVRG
jgi:hypothetical protein